MRSNSLATRSIRRVRREIRPPSRAVQTPEAAIQVFLFRMDRFLGTMLFDGQNPILVGRHKNAEIRLEGEIVSRRHCQLVLHDGQVFVEDLGSGNGTFLNRERVMRREPVRATDGLCIGPFTLKIRCLRAAPLPPADELAADRTTKIEAILTADRTGGTDEAVIDVQKSFDQALYDDAIRRKTGGERARPATRSNRPPPVEPPPPQRPTNDSSHVSRPHLVRPAHMLENDSTLLAAAEVSLRPDTDGVRLDPEVEARLKDLDDLIASLDERYGSKDRRASSIPWRNEPSEASAPAPSIDDGGVPQHLIAEDSSIPGAARLSTREFARDLASRLALDGSVVTPSVETLEKKPAQEAPAPEAPAAPAPTPAPIHETPPPEAPIELDSSAFELHGEEPTEASDEQVEPIAKVPGAPMDDGPETELMDREIPILMEPRLPSIVAQTRPPIAPEPPARKEPARIHEADLLTPTPQEPPALPFEQSVDGDHSYDDVWTNGSMHREDLRERPAGHHILVERAPEGAPRGPMVKRSLTHARPKSRIDDFDPSAKPPPLPSTAYDGVEIAARTRGRLVDIAVLRRASDQYILGHRTPQGAVAPGKAHLGLRLLRINDDRTVDLVFPLEAGGHLVRGAATVMFSELTEGRRYSCLRLDPTDVATVILGEGKSMFSYHVRFLRRPKSLFRSLRRSIVHDDA